MIYTPETQAQDWSKDSRRVLSNQVNEKKENAMSINSIISETKINAPELSLVHSRPPLLDHRSTNRLVDDFMINSQLFRETA